MVKADGLAAGKGVIIAQTVAEAEDAIDMMLGGGLGEAGAELVIEEFLDRRRGFVLRALRRRDRDLRSRRPRITSAHSTATQGPNTGGMGAYSPAPIIDPAMSARVMAEIVTRPCGR